MTNSTDKQDACQLLTTDHRTVEDLFDKYGNATGLDRKQTLVGKITTELKIHAQIEEEIFYPALRGKIDEDLLNEAYVEHDGAKLLINELASAEPDEKFYDAKVKVLKEEIEHHVGEEEKMNGSMFTQARKADVDLDGLADKMRSLKEELTNKAKTGGLPPAEMSTMQRT